jgi:hypothetical protein
MQQIFVKDIKDSTFNTDVLAKLKKEHIPLQIYWHNEPEAKFSGAILHDFHKLCLEVEIAGRHLQFTCYEMINGDITVDYNFGNKHYTTEDILVRNEGCRVNDRVTVGDPIHMWINTKDHTQIDVDAIITHINFARIRFICNSFTDPAQVQAYSIRTGIGNDFVLQFNDKTLCNIYNPIWCPLVPRDLDEEEDEENESCDE